MVIMSVSRSKEKAMINSGSVLPRLLRKAFLVTNRVNVTRRLQGGQAACNGQGSPPDATSINEATRPLQPRRIELTALSYRPSISFFMLSRNEKSRQWRSSLGVHDKCHTGPS